MSEMKIRSSLRTVILSIILLIYCNYGWSQVVVERSKDKVVISGVTYYIHQVRKGETAYSISRAYGVTVEELTKENPPIVYGLSAGQSLRIPYRPVPETDVYQKEVPKREHNEAKYIYHYLKPGETIYFLSKSYDVSESEIIQSNPGIDITKLSVGMEIAIPRKDFMSNRQKFDETDKPKVKVQEEQQTVVQKNVTTQSAARRSLYHKVNSGESLSSIAERYGLTVRALRKANRDLRFPQVGDSLRIPGEWAQENKVIIPVIADTIVPPEGVSVLKSVRPAEYTPVNDLRGSLDVAVLLPFYLRENAMRMEIDSSGPKAKKNIKITRRDDAWIYPGSLDFIEMYEGILLAADTIRSLGMNINLHTYDIKSDTVELMKIINAGKLEGMDLIIGPVYPRNLSIVADYARDLGIPVVSPVPLYDNSVLSGNTGLFLASSSLEVSQQALAGKFGEYSDHNFIFIHSDTLGIDEDVQRFRRLILTELGSRIPYEEIKFREFPFYSRSMFGNDSINRLSHALSDRSKNIVVIASEEAPVISETMIDVHSLSRKFDIKVFGYPVMRDLDNLDPRYIFDLDLMIYSNYWINYSERDVIQFNADFRQKFLTEPSERSYAWQGYDIAYYFISGLAIHGKEFMLHPEIHRPDLLQTDYAFESKTVDWGFENRNLFLIRYTNNYEVKLVDTEVIPQDK